MLGFTFRVRTTHTTTVRTVINVPGLTTPYRPQNVGNRPLQTDVLYLKLLQKSYNKSNLVRP